VQWTRRRIGYVVWGAGALFFVVPELLAAVPLTESQLPFPTISRTIGHLEAREPRWEILPTVLVVLFMYALLRVHTQAPEEPDENENAEFRKLVRNAVLSAAVIALATILAFRHWPNQYVPYQDDPHHKLPNFEVAYVLYGVTFLLWVVLPTSTVLRTNRYPSLVQTVLNVDQWLRSFRGVGRGAAWVVGFLLVWGMVFLLLHLTLYPFPNITRQLNHTEITCGTEVVSRWHEGCVVHG
jgi:hypothetical protein